MVKKSKKPTSAKESQKAKVEKSKKKKKAVNPKVDHIEEDVLEGNAMEKEVKPAPDSDEEMAPEGLADPDGGDKKPMSPANTEPKLPLMERHRFGVFVRCLNDNVTEADLQKFFESVGRVFNVRFIDSESAAIVFFQKAGLVEKALTLDNTSLKGWPAYVEPYWREVRPKKPKKPKQLSKGPLKNEKQKKTKASKKKREKMKTLMASIAQVKAEGLEIKTDQKK